MLCRKSSVKRESESVPVYLNVYDLTSINGYAYWLGLGVYHSGLQVHGVEYAFGAHEYSTTGIFEGEPKQCDGFVFRKSILMGWTEMTSEEVRGVMEELSEKYKGNSYNLITKNCNHFCNDASIKLIGIPIPNWINRLARIGFLCNCIVPVSLNATKVGHHMAIEDKACIIPESLNITRVGHQMAVIEDKLCIIPESLNTTRVRQHIAIEEGNTCDLVEKTQFSSNPNGLDPSTPCSCSSPPSSSPCTRRGRSRTRRPPPPSSPSV